MDAAAAAEFVRTNHRGVLATTRRDGQIQMSPVTATLGHDGRVWISSRETAYKVRHAERTGRATYCGLNDGFYGAWVQVEGPVEVIHLPEAMELLVAYYRSVSGEHPDWDDYRTAMVRDRRVIMALTIERAGPTVSG
jgi:PPOX class probable F420-dependent enzyme